MSRNVKIMLVGGPQDGRMEIVPADPCGRPPVEAAVPGRYGDDVYKLTCAVTDPLHGRLVYTWEPPPRL